MAGSGSTASVTGSVYDLYNTTEVLEMMDMMEEPMMEGSDDDLELDMGSGEHEG